jgi:hypothetical protein
MLSSRSITSSLALFLAGVLATGCGESPDLATTPDEPTPAADLAMAHGTVSGPFAFLPPLAPDVRSEGHFDGTRSPVVEICLDPDCEDLLVRYATSEGEVAVDEEDEHYAVNWSLRTTGVPEGGHFHLRVMEGVESLGALHVVVGPAARGGSVARGATPHPGMVVPIRFRLEAGTEDPGPEPEVGIGPEGGTVLSADARVTLVVPPGALSEPTEITIEPSPLEADDPGMVAALLYRFGPTDLAFAVPAGLTIEYGGAVPDGTDPGELRILRAGEAGWSQVPGVIRNAEAGWVRVELDGFSDYGVGAAQVDAVRPDPEALDMQDGEEALIELEVTDMDGTVLDRSASWASSNPAVALVDSEGVVTATGPGNATIVATVEGVMASVPVRVGAPDPIAATVEVTPAESTLAAGATTQLTAVVLDASGFEIPGFPVVWTTDDPCVAVVGPDGVVEAIGGGPVTITAEAGDASGAAEVSVPDGEAGVPESLTGGWKMCRIPEISGQITTHIADFDLIHEAGSSEVIGTVTEISTGSTYSTWGIWHASGFLQQLAWAVPFQGSERAIFISGGVTDNQDRLRGTLQDGRSGQSYPVKLVRLR